jgi:hypothetical protein
MRLDVLIYKLVLKNHYSANFTVNSNDVVSSKLYFTFKLRTEILTNSSNDISLLEKIVFSGYIDLNNYYRGNA